MDYNKHAKIFKALSDENRLAIIDILNDGKQCACVILERLNITQPTLSHHMKILCDANIVTAKRDGKWTHYTINAEGTEYFKKIVGLYINNESETI